MFCVAVFSDESHNYDVEDNKLSELESSIDIYVFIIVIILPTAYPPVGDFDAQHVHFPDEKCKIKAPEYFMRNCIKLMDKINKKR